MTKHFRTLALAGVAALSLSLAACGGGGASTGDASADSNGGGAKNITIRGCTPKNPLIPGNTTETCGGDMVTAMTANLVHYNPEDSSVEMDIAESIESTDSTLFTVKLKKGFKFHDGTEVKAKNFVDAWNYTAAFDNGQGGSYFMTPIKGYEAVNVKGSPVKEMEGLKVVDDYTFTIETSSPTSNLPVRLGYSSFAPLPDSFFADPAAFEEHPIGAGPFKFVSKTPSEYVFEKFADYVGSYPAQIDGLTFSIFDDDNAAYAAVQGNTLDYTNSIPPTNLIGDRYKSDLPDRNLVRETGRFAGLVFSPADPQFKDNPDLRAAISMAIDRELIAKQIFNGSVKPAHGWAPAFIDGATDTACGEKCDFNPEKAKALYEKSGGYEGTLTITVNGDADHQTWSDAVCNSIKNTLGLECLTSTTADFATFQKKVKADELQGMFRTGWQMDYPSIENFLAPIYGTGSESNWSQYDNPAFNAKLTEAAATSDHAAANKLYAEAEAMLGEDLPTAPLWYPQTVVGWSERVDNVHINPFGVIEYSDITVK